MQATAANFSVMHNVALDRMTTTFNTTMAGAVVYNYDTFSFLSNLVNMSSEVSHSSMQDKVLCTNFPLVVTPICTASALQFVCCACVALKVMLQCLFCDID